MGLCSERRQRKQLRSCVIRYGKPCLACKEDIQLERNWLQNSKLQNRRRSLQTRMNANHDPFVLKFPPEIASHILCLSMDDKDYDPDEDALKTLPMQFLLGTVCRGWRQLARSTPELWSTLSFTLTKPTNVEGLPLLQVITDWLQLSGNLPLTLSVFDSRTKCVSRGSCGPVIDALNQHSERWNNVFLCLLPSFFGDFCGTSPLNSLYKLQIARAPWDSGDDLPAFRMRSRPSPVHLFISDFRLMSIDILWNNLTSLVMENMVLHDCIEAIRQAPLLESCGVGVDYFRSSPPDILSFPNKTIVRPLHLRTLSLSGFTAELLIGFLSVLELPSLDDYCYLKSLGTVIAVDEVISLLNRSGSRLKRLKLWIQCERVPAAKELKKLLNAVPYLQTFDLELNCSSHTDSLALPDLLQVFSSSPPTLPDGTPGFLPHLQALYLTFTPCGASVWGYIPRIYSWTHRKNLGLEANSYIGGFSESMGVDDLAKILHLIDQGIHIRILHQGEDYLQQFKLTVGI